MFTLGFALAMVILAQADVQLRIDSVVPLPNQPQSADPAVIWFDDFDGAEKPYTESAGGVDERNGYGGAGRSMVCLYRKGEQGIGNRKVFFGDSPTGRIVRKGELFEDVYWRVYVKHQPGWSGGGEAKLSRITSIVSPRWEQAMIGHVWSSGERLTLDPASGVREGSVVTTRYNDFANLRWLGNLPAARLPLSGTTESGWWCCVEARVKLNTPRTPRWSYAALDRRSARNRTRGARLARDLQEPWPECGLPRGLLERRLSCDPDSLARQLRDLDPFHRSGRRPAPADAFARRPRRFARSRRLASRDCRVQRHGGLAIETRHTFGQGDR
jgi:hypothetical protein